MHLLLQECIYAEIDISEYRREIRHWNRSMTHQYTSDFMRIGRYVILLAYHAKLQCLLKGVIFWDFIKVEIHASNIASLSK